MPSSAKVASYPLSFEVGQVGDERVFARNLYPPVLQDLRSVGALHRFVERVANPKAGPVSHSEAAFNYLILVQDAKALLASTRGSAS